MNTIQASRSTFIIITLAANKTKYKFGKQSILEGKDMIHIQQLASGTTPNGETIATNQNYSTLQDKTGVIFHQFLPSNLLVPSQNYALAFDPIPVDWEKSYVDVVGAITAGQVLYFQVFYTE